MRYKKGMRSHAFFIPAENLHPPHIDIHDLNVSNLATFNSEISDYTNIKHV